MKWALSKSRARDENSIIVFVTWAEIAAKTFVGRDEIQFVILRTFEFGT